MVRIKNRWLLIQVHLSQEHSSDDARSSSSTTAAVAAPMQLQLLRAIRHSLDLAFGETGAGALGGALAVRYYSPTTHNAIVRCSRTAYEYVWAAITLCDRLNARPARLIVTHCGGTIRKVQQAAIRADRRMIERLTAERKIAARGMGMPLSNEEAQRALQESKQTIEAMEQ